MKKIPKPTSLLTAKNIRNNEDSISIVPVDPGQATRRGSKPILIRCQDHADECRRIASIAKVLLNGNVPFNEITINRQPHEIDLLSSMYQKRLKIAIRAQFRHIRFLTGFG